MKSGEKIKLKKIQLLNGSIVPVILILMIAGFLTYSNTFDASFHWDDEVQIVGNEDIHDLSTYSKLSEWASLQKRPVSKFTLAVNWSLGGQNVLGYHIVNLLLHILTALIVYMLTKLTISTLSGEKRIDQRMTGATALFVALLFLLHPLQTMAVTYIVQRMTILAALFYLLAVYLYARGRMACLRDARKRRSAIFIFMAVLSGLLGLMSKQNAVTFPAAFLLYEIFFVRTTEGKLCRKYAMVFGGLLLSGFLIVLFAGFLPAETEMVSRMGYLGTQLGVFHKYLLLLLFPISQNADYFIMHDGQLIGTYGIIGIVLIAGLLISSILLYKRNRLISFGILWIFISMSVESGLIPIKDIMMEHRMYLPMFGYGMILAGIIVRYVPFGRIKYFYAVGSIVLIILAFATYNRNKVWESEISLWEDCLEKNPRSRRAMNNLGYAIKTRAMQNPYPDMKRLELIKSIGYFNLAMAGDTMFTDAYFNRGLAYIELEEYEKALADIKMIESQRPRERYLRHYLEGIVYARSGDMPRAKELFDSAIGLNPDFALLYTWRGLVLSQLKQDQAAIDDFIHSLELDPRQSILFINISQLYYNLMEYEQALHWIRMAGDAGENLDAKYIDTLEKALKDK